MKSWGQTTQCDKVHIVKQAFKMLFLACLMKDIFLK